MNTNQTARFTLSGHEGFQAIPENPAPGAETRIASVVPLVVKMVSRWRRRLTPRIQALIDNADAVQEVWVRLLQADHLFDESKSAYTTWARMITSQTLARLAVPKRVGPRQADETDVLDVEPTTPGDVDVAETAARREAAEIASQTVRPVLAKLDDRSFWIITTAYGIDTKPLTTTSQAEWLLISYSKAVNIRTTAERALCDYILSRTG